MPGGFQDALRKIEIFRLKERHTCGFFFFSLLPNNLETFREQWQSLTPCSEVPSLGVGIWGTELWESACLIHALEARRGRSVPVEMKATPPYCLNVG